MRTNQKIFILLLVAAILLRLPGLSLPYAGEEHNVLLSLQENIWSYPHPPLITALFFIVGVLGTSEIILRMVPFLFGILSIFMVYKIGTEFYNETVALWAVFLLALSGSHAVSSLFIMPGGTIFEALSLILFYNFLKFEKTRDKKYYYRTGIFLGLAFLTKYTAIMFFGAMGLYKLIQTRSLWKTTRNTAPLFLMGLAIFSIFPILDFLLNNGALFYSTLGRLASVTISTTPAQSGFYNTNILLHHLRSKGTELLFLSPLFVSLFAFSLTKYRKLIHDFFFIYVVSMLIFYNALTPYAEVFRFVLILLAPLSILGGIILSEHLPLNRDRAALLGVFTAIFFSILLLLNLGPQSILSFAHPATLFQHLSQLNFSLYIPVFMLLSALRFFLSLKLILFAFGGSLVLLLGILFSSKKTKNAAILFLLLISLGTAYNLFFASEFLYHTTSPDYDQASRELIEYSHTHELKEPVYFNDLSMGVYYLGDRYNPYPSPPELMGSHFVYANIYDPVFLDTFQESLQLYGGSVVMIDFPTIDKERGYWPIILQECTSKKTITDKNTITGCV